MSARILIVDDIEANRRLLQAKLEAQYHTVMTASNGFDAITIARESQPEIILLDVMMPGMDGYEVCRQLKRDPVTSHIPVVMVTALNDTEDRVKGLDAGAEDFLTKPIDDFMLNSRVGALMRYNTVASELRQREQNGLRAGAVEGVPHELLDKPATVFVVDDNPRTSARIATMLRDAGNLVSTLLEAGDLGKIGKERVDVLLLSLMTAKFDPLKLCAQFKSNELTRAISILLIVDPDERVRALKGLEVGASDVIFTPVDRQELVARIRTQARRTRYIDILRQRVDRGLELSVIDQLTGLHNRRYMTNQLQPLMQRAVIGGRPLSLMLTDIDHFKAVNDNYGHVTGDEVLQELAIRLRENVRPTDLVCRTGGEEFAVIMPDTPGDLAAAAAERIRQSVASTSFVVAGGRILLNVTISAGVASLSGPEDTIADLFKRADDALYAAKSAGRNRVECIAAA